MAAGLVDNRISVCPLDTAAAGALEALFEEQREEWLSVMRWDYTLPSRAIHEVILRGELCGFFASVRPATGADGTTDAVTAGLSYFLVEDDRASIGDLFVSRRFRGLGISGQLATAVLDDIESQRGVRRIESQSVWIDNRSAAAVFERRGFRRFERAFMSLALDSWGNNGPAVTRSDHPSTGIGVRSWKEGDFDAAARIVQNSYVGRDDSLINVQYQTATGCADVIAMLIDHTWCGTFLPEASFVAIDQATAQRVGVLVASRIADGVGHIGQVSVLSSHQGKGVGRRLMHATLHEFKRRAFDCVTLAVTLTNEPAVRLYTSLGFATVLEFPVFYLERGCAGPSDSHE